MADNTKNIILKEALILFSSKGYNSTSVRDISEAAGVNVAAINYHFGSKVLLFQTVVREHIQSLDNELKDSLLSDPSMTTKEAIWIIYQCFIKNGDSLLSIFRVMLTSGAEFPDSPIKVGEFIGPPGGAYLLDIIKREVGPSVNKGALLWAVHLLFSHLFHISVLICTEFGEQKLAKLPFFQDDYKKRTLDLFVESILTKIQEQGIDWSQLDVTCGMGDPK